MSRLIKTESAGKERARLSKAVVVAIRELAKQNDPGNEARDLAAFIVLALESIAATIDETVAAWEKRNYWVKADRFRMDWAWSGDLAARMREALMNEDWQQVASITVRIGQSLSKIQVADKHRLGRPWVGAWDKLK